jgi:hypothetical protein
VKPIRLLLAATCLGVGPAVLFFALEGQSPTNPADAAYRTLPPYPGAKQIEHEIGGPGEAGDEGSTAMDGGAGSVFHLPSTATVARVERFYTTRLHAAGWKLSERLPGVPGTGPVLNFERGQLRVSINLEGGYGQRPEVGVLALSSRPKT